MAPKPLKHKVQKKVQALSQELLDQELQESQGFKLNLSHYHQLSVYTIMPLTEQQVKGGISGPPT